MANASACSGRVDLFQAPSGRCHRHEGVTKRQHDVTWAVVACLLGGNGWRAGDAYRI